MYIGTLTINLKNVHRFRPALMKKSENLSKRIGVTCIEWIMVLSLTKGTLIPYG